MGISDHLSYSLGHRDQGPNRILAKQIVHKGGKGQLKELVDFFLTQPQKELQKDAVLTMAWVAEEAPELVVPYTSVLIHNFDSPINRVIWGSMIALSEIAHLVQPQLFQALPKILDAMEAGTVVTKDYGFRILLTLYSEEEFREDLNPIMLEVIYVVPDNQLGQYAEKWTAIVKKNHIEGLSLALEERKPELENVFHQRRLDKILKKLSRLKFA